MRIHLGYMGYGGYTHDAQKYGLAVNGRKLLVWRFRQPLAAPIKWLPDIYIGPHDYGRKYGLSVNDRLWVTA